MRSNAPNPLQCAHRDLTRAYRNLILSAPLTNTLGHNSQAHAPRYFCSPLQLSNGLGNRLQLAHRMPGTRRPPLPLPPPVQLASGGAGARAILKLRMPLSLVVLHLLPNGL